jgi:hypothetical protein
MTDMPARPAAEEEALTMTDMPARLAVAEEALTRTDRSGSRRSKKCSQ